MSKPIKDLMTQEYRRRYGDLDGACLVSVIGLDAIATNKLRGELLARKLRLHVVKNSLARRALGDTALAPISAALKGPCALVTGGESVIDAAKTLVGLKKTYTKMELLVGILDGDKELVGVEQLATMKSRTETLGDLSGLIRSPGGRLSGCLLGGGRIAGCLKAIIEKAEKAAPAEAAPSAN